LKDDSLEDKFQYITETGEQLICPDLSEGMSKSAEWLVNYLPPIIFDID